MTIRHGDERPLRAAVTGATGCIGRALIDQLSAQGTVKALHRSQPAGVAGREVGVVAGDLDDRRALKELVRDADVVFHCAATMGKSDVALSHRVNVAGTMNVACAALEAGVARFVYVSSISVYAATRTANSTITEDVEPARIDRLNAYSRTKLEGERVLQRLAEEGLAYTVVRPTNVYGPWSGPWFQQWADLLERTAYVIGDLAIDVVHVNDIATAMIQAATATPAANGTFHLGHESVRLGDFVRRVGDVVKRPVRALPAPVDALLRTAIERGYRAVTGRHMSLSLTRPVFYPCEKARRAFGYAPAIGLDEGFRDLEEWYAGRSQRLTGRPE